MSTTVQDDAAQLAELGYESHFERRMGLWENFALGFTYLSPVVGVYSTFAIAFLAGGPPMIWSIVIAGVGQLLVALVFAEVVAQFPVAGGVYPWARRLIGRRWAWITGWIYGWALIATVASVSTGAAPFIGSLFDFTPTRTTTVFIAAGLMLFALLVNLSGTRTLGRVAMAGFVAELIGALFVGLLAADLRAPSRLRHALRHARHGWRRRLPRRVPGRGAARPVPVLRLRGLR